jgi:predicted nucleotidyltransferase component of viral defense system
MFSRREVADAVLFRGGTALHKLFFAERGRYSEDIDLVQKEAGPIGSLVDAIREEVDPWLGLPQWKQGQDRFTLYYRFETSFAPIVKMRVKIEINTREHFSILPTKWRPFAVDNPWFRGNARLSVYQLDELLGTKLRALYQRKKGRDLFDLWLALERCDVNPQQVVDCFLGYLEAKESTITKAQFEENLSLKLQDEAFLRDLVPLVGPGVEFDPLVAADRVQQELIALFPGQPWKGSG